MRVAGCGPRSEALAHHRARVWQTPGSKVYVQNKLAEHKDLVWQLIHEGRGHFYVCGCVRSVEYPSCVALAADSSRRLVVAAAPTWATMSRRLWRPSPRSSWPQPQMAATTSRPCTMKAAMWRSSGRSMAHVNIKFSFSSDHHPAPSRQLQQPRRVTAQPNVAHARACTSHRAVLAGNVRWSCE